MKYSWLWFDADDTLFDYPHAEAYALESASRDLGLGYSPAVMTAYREINQRIWQEFELGRINAADLRAERFARLFTRLGVGIDPNAFSARYLERLAEGAVLLPGAAELLARLAGSFRLGLITNGLPEVQRPRLGAAGIAGYFAFVAISEEIGLTKPDPRFFERALQLAGSPDRSSVLVIGDSLSSDIRGGKQTGLDTLWYNPSGKPVDPRWPPTYEVRSLEEIPPLLAVP